MVRSLIDKTKYCLADLQRPDFRKLWTPIIDFKKSFQFYSIGIILLAGISGGIFVAFLIGKNDFRTVTFIASMTLLSAAIGQNLVIIFFVKKIIGRFDRSDGSIALMVLCLVLWSCWGLLEVFMSILFGNYSLGI